MIAHQEGLSVPRQWLPQAFYNAQAGIRRLTTETGAGQWGSALAFACAQYGIECEVWQVRASYDQKPYRKMMIETFGGTIHPSPSDLTEAGRAILAKDPDSPGSLGIAISEVVEVAVAALSAAGIAGVSIDFTLPDLVRTLAGDALEPARLAKLVERLDAKDAGGVAAIDRAYLPLIEAAGPFDAAMARLRALDSHAALATRLDGLAQVAAGLSGRVGLTLDPTERHNFEYQSWLGFSLFADGLSGEIGRGTLFEG